MMSDNILDKAIMRFIQREKYLQKGRQMWVSAILADREEMMADKWKLSRFDE